MLKRETLPDHQTGAERWREVGVVDLPKRSRAASAVMLALEEADEVQVNDGGEFRVVAADDPIYTLREKPLPAVEERFEVVTL